MENISIGKETSVKTHLPEQADLARVVASGEQTLRRKISENPGLALAIAATVGVLVACLIKRR